jgi:hypothetical protein
LLEQTRLSTPVIDAALKGNRRKRPLGIIAFRFIPGEKEESAKAASSLCIHAVDFLTPASPKHSYISPVATHVSISS